MRVVTWNMNYWPRSDDARTKSWDFLRLELRADIALVQEAVPPPDVDAVLHPIDPDNPRQRWGTAAGVAVDVWDRPAAWALSDHCPIVVDLPGA